MLQLMREPIIRPLNNGVAATFQKTSINNPCTPEGSAHGFCVTTDVALFGHRFTRFYNPAPNQSIAWNEPDIGIDWQIDTPELSTKDKEGIRLKDFPNEILSVRQSALQNRLCG